MKAEKEAGGTIALTNGLPLTIGGISNAGGGDNLHRNVIYRDGADKADQHLSEMAG